MANSSSSQDSHTSTVTIPSSTTTDDITSFSSATCSSPTALVSSSSIIDGHAVNIDSAFFDEFDVSIDFPPTVSPALVLSGKDSVARTQHGTAPLFSRLRSAFWDDEFPTSSSSTTTMADRPYASPVHQTFTEQSAVVSGSNSNASSNNPFRIDSVTFAQQSWQAPIFDHASNGQTHTPLVPATYEPFSTDFGPLPTTAFSPSMTVPAPFHSGPAHANIQPATMFSAANSITSLTIASPMLGKEWISTVEQETEPRPLPKRLRQASPPRMLSPFGKRPGDGIRKKLARVDIPAERSLLNIDHLIASSTNEDEIKELKSQKRLLRNRQAALDSRQRKKKQYEDAQEEKRASNERSIVLEEEMIAVRQIIEEKDLLINDLWQKLQALELEKENMVQAHEKFVMEKTVESGELRGKINVLTERLNGAQSSRTTTVTASSNNASDFNDFTNEMDGLNMGSEWDDFSYMNDFCIDGETKPADLTTSLIPRKKQALEVVEEDKPIASGILLMLLLCGAWVTSKTSGTQVAQMPRMPDEVRAASTVVLESVLKDAGVGLPDAHSAVTSTTTDLHVVEPLPSGSVWARPNDGVITNFQHDHASNFGLYTDSLMHPSKEQEVEQAFSLSATQYNSLTGDYSHDPHQQDVNNPGSNPANVVHHRRNLAESLKAMREDTRGSSAAEVFTRSLLWDTIPSEVVKEFKRMVEATSGGGALNVGGCGSGGGSTLSSTVVLR